MTSATPEPVPTERLTSQPTARTYRVEELVRLVHGGQLRVPDFQRVFRWGVADVEDLFDSLLRGFPVGSLLLWHRKGNPAQTVKWGELAVAASASEDALWVVDGQQRVTSLVNALDAGASERSNTFALVYDLSVKKVVRRGRGVPEMSVPMPVLFDLRRLLGWVMEHPEMGEHIETLNGVATTLRDVAVPASIVSTSDDAVLREIFDRTNNSGKRLRRAEVFSSLFGPSAGGDDALTLTAVAEGVDASTRFGRIDDDTVLGAVLACRGSDISREIRREFTEARSGSAEFDDDQQAAYARAQEALRAAVTFLQEDIGVPHVAFLPYRYLLVVLTRYFAHFPSPYARNRALLARWFWIAALRGPGVFKGSATGAARSLCSRIAPKDESGSVQELLAAVDEPHEPQLPNLDRFRTNNAATRVILCALWSLGPRSPGAGGAVITRDDLAVVLEGQQTAVDVVFDVVPRQKIANPRSAADRVIAAPEDSDTARGRFRGQSDLFASASTDDEDDDAFFASHAIDAVAQAALARGDDEGFVAARAETLTSLLVDFARSRTGLGLEATPPLHEMEFDEDDDERDDVLDLTGPHED